MINEFESQLIAICLGAAQRCEERHEYMGGASSDAHNWFPHKWVIDALRDAININSSELAKLKAETESLRKDAERYRYLRSGAAAWGISETNEYEPMMICDEYADDILDAAISSPENP